MLALFTEAACHQVNALRTRMFEPKVAALRLVYVRILLILIEAGVTVATTLYFRNVFNDHCFDGDATQPVCSDLLPPFRSLLRVPQLSRISVTVVACGWIHTGLAFVFLCITNCFGEERRFPGSVVIVE